MNYIKSYCRIVPGRVTLNGDLFFESDFGTRANPDSNPNVVSGFTTDVNQSLSPEEKLRSAHDFFSAIYGHIGADYRKFYKMDALSKLGFISSEILLARLDKESPKEDMGIVLFNRNSSLETDRRYQKTIQNKEDFFPSPAEFVYTLPNIVTGEIAIRNKIYGETAFYIASDFCSDSICEVVDDMMNLAGMKYVLAGWTEVDAFTGDINGLMLLCEAEDLCGGHEEKGRMMPLQSDVLKDL